MFCDERIGSTTSAALVVRAGVDRFAALVTHVLPAPLLLAPLLLAVRCTSRGPVLFRQTRVRRAGRPVAMPKSRSMRQGLTGLRQISGRSDLPWEDSRQLDLQYVQTRSSALDTAVLFRTVPAVRRAEGAY